VGERDLAGAIFGLPQIGALASPLFAKDAKSVFVDIWQSSGVVGCRRVAWNSRKKDFSGLFSQI
jgi:hypothetical protein